MSRPERSWSRMLREGCSVLLIASAILACGESATTSPAKRSSCLVATVGEHPVTESDAESLRALIQPPPTPEEAARLAVAVTIAAVRIEPGAALPGMGRRLALYRDSLERDLEQALEVVRPGPCWAGRRDGHGALPIVDASEIRKTSGSM